MKTCYGIGMTAGVVLVSGAVLLGQGTPPPVSGRIGGAAATEPGSSTISGRIGGAAATGNGASTISGTVGGGAATESGSRTISGGIGMGSSTGLPRASLSGDAISTRAGLGTVTNIGTTNSSGVLLR